MARSAYTASGSRKAQFVVQSIYIHRNVDTSYRISIEFDSLNSVEQGEGIRWGARSDDLDSIIESLESFIGKPLSEWTNHTKLGLQPFYDSEIVTDEHYRSSLKVFEERYEYGKLLLPKGLQFVLQTPTDIATAKNRSKYQRSNRRKND